MFAVRLLTESFERYAVANAGGNFLAPVRLLQEAATWAHWGQHRGARVLVCGAIDARWPRHDGVSAMVGAQQAAIALDTLASHTASAGISVEQCTNAALHQCATPVPHLSPVRLGPESADEIVELIAASAPAMLLAGGASNEEAAAWVSAKFNRDRVLDSLASPATTVFGLRAASWLLGVGALTVAGDVGTVHMGYVHPSVQGRGHGATLFAARVDLGRRLGLTALRVVHLPSNHRVARAAERHGFQRPVARADGWAESRLQLRTPVSAPRAHGA